MSRYVQLRICTFHTTENCQKRSRERSRTWAVGARRVREVGLGRELKLYVVKARKETRFASKKLRPPQPESNRRFRQTKLLRISENFPKFSSKVLRKFTFGRVLKISCGICLSRRNDISFGSFSTIYNTLFLLFNFNLITFPSFKFSTFFHQLTQKMK